MLVSKLYEQPNIFPNFPLFSRLLGYAHRLPDSNVVVDVVSGKKATHIQLLTHVLSLRDHLWKSLDAATKTQLDRDEEVFILVLAPPGYEYVVAFLAVLALGAIVMPISPHAPFREALYFLQKTEPKGMVFDERSGKLADAIVEHYKLAEQSFLSLDVSHSLPTVPLGPREIFISQRHYLNSSGAGLTIFTSGTTGPPKAVILPRDILLTSCQALVDHFELTPSDVIYNCMPMHHIAGITSCLIPFLLGGTCIEIEPFDVARVWSRLGSGGITVFGGVPTMFMRLMRHYEDVIQGSAEQDGHVEGLRRLRILMCGTSALPRPLRLKWTELSGKRPLERYGTSEFAIGALTPLHNNDSVPDGSVGVVIPGCDIRLSPEQELLVKAPGMFLRYHKDEAATAAAFDSDEYYKTGDIGRMEGPHLWISGRASIDMIKSGGYKISALDIEREVLSLDYISEVAVFGVEDEEYGQRVAAVIVMRDPRQHLALTKLRDDLRHVLSGYRLPTLLYVAKKELDKTSSGKVQKKMLRKELFESRGSKSEIQIFEKGRRRGVGVRL